MIRALPNALTLLNLIGGACAVAAFFENNPVVTLVLAAICLILDVCDGLLARRLNVSSELGIQLDSLADSVSFGVLPSCILFGMLRSGAGSGPEYLHYVAFAFAAGVALRLARFNLDTRERSVFYGLPSPSAAVMVFGLLLIRVTDHPWYPFISQPLVIYGVVLLLTLLMLTNLRLWSLKGLGYPRGKWIAGGLVTTALILILFTGSAGIVLTVVMYVVFGLVNVFLKLY